MTDNLYHLDLILFAIGTQIEIEPGPRGGSAWCVRARINHETLSVAVGYGERPWVAVEEAMKDAARKR